MHIENFGGVEGSKDERPAIDPGYEMPGLQEVPAELPEKDKRKFPEGIEHWPDISDRVEVETFAKKTALDRTLQMTKVR
jgi:hypothetical protein